MGWSGWVSSRLAFHQGTMVDVGNSMQAKTQDGAKGPSMQWVTGLRELDGGDQS